MKHPFSPNRGSFTRTIKLLLLTLVCFIGLQKSASATHFRYHSASWSHSPTAPLTVTFQITQAWRWSAYGNPALGTIVNTGGYTYGDGTADNLNMQVTSINSTEDWFTCVATLTHTYAAAGNYNANYSSCCRISTLLDGNNDQSESISTLVTLNGPFNNSPVTGVPAIVNMQLGVLNTFAIPGFDPDGDALSFSISSSAESALPTPFPAGLTLSPSGVISYTPPSGGLRALSVKVTDSKGSYTMVDFIIRASNSTSTPPFYNYSITPANNFVYSVQPGTPINFGVQASDVDAGAQVTLTATGVPSGATFTPSLPVLGNPTLNTNFSWTPTIANLGSYIISFTATDNNSQQTITNVIINVNVNPVFDYPPTPPNGTGFCLMTGVPFSQLVQAQNTLSNLNTEITSVSGLSGTTATTTPALPTGLAPIAQTTLNWTPAPSEWGPHTATFVATDAASNTATTSFNLLVNTSPVFTSGMPSSSATVGTPYSHALSGTDANTPYGDALSFHLVGAPAWLSLTDNGNGTGSIQGTPALADIGSYTFDIILEDIYHHCGPVVKQTVTINVQNCNTTVNSTASACVTYTWPVNGATYTQSGTYSHTVTTAGLYASNGGAAVGATNGGAIMKVNPANANSVAVGTPSPGDGVTGIDFMTNGDMYGFIDNGTLVKLDPSTGLIASTIGQVTLNGNPIILTDMAIDPTTNTIYGATGPAGSASNKLVTVSATTAVATYIGQPVPAGSFLAIAFDGAGTLYGLRTNQASGLLTIDKSNGNVLTNTPLSFTMGAVGLGMDKVNNVLYASECCQFGIQGNNMYTITPSGLVTYIGSFGGSTRVQDLAFNTAGCVTTYNLTLTINPLPVVTAPNISACPGSPVTLGGSPAGGVWSLPNPYLGPTTPYTYYYTDNNGCMGSATANVTVGTPIITNMTATNITGISASINYQAVGGIGWYELRWRKFGSGNAWTTGTNFNYTTKTLINLTPNTLYEVECRGFCSTTMPAGTWTNLQFSTNGLCSVPTGLYATNVAANYATLNWNAVPGVAFYGIRYKPSSVPTWNTGTCPNCTVTTTNIANNKLILNLMAGTTYDFQVRSNCGGSAGAWSATGNFTTSAFKGVASATPEEVSNSNIHIYPNPTQNECNVEFLSTEYGIASIKILDMAGRVVMEQQAEVEEGKNIVIMNLGNLTNGVYAIHVYNNNQFKSATRVIKN